MTSPELNTSDISPLRTLRNQYFALVPPRLIRLPPPPTLASPAGQARLLRLLEERRFPQPEDGYRRLFWRGVLRELELGLRELQEMETVSQVEESELEIDERFYELMAGLMIGSADIDPQQSHRTFIYTAPSSSTHAAEGASSDQAGRERCITLLEEQTVLQGGTTGLRTWTAALHLAHHLVHHPSTLLLRHPTTSPASPRTILELGAGTGFLTILLSQQGYKVTSTDLGDVLGGGLSPLDRLRHNVGLNGLEDSIQVTELDWLDAQRDSSSRPPIWVELERDPPDTIIAADVIYDPDLVPPLVAALSTLLHPRSASQSPRQALIAATVRNPATLELFVDDCSQSNLDVVEVELPRSDPDHPTFWDSGLDVDVPVRIMRITPRMQAI